MSQVSDIGIMAAGATLVILVGGIDLSVAAVMALTMMFSAWLYQDGGVPWPIAMIAGLALGAFVGLLNGLLATYGRVQAFVATLATMSASAGMALFITSGSTINGFPTWFGDLTAMDLFGIPLQGVLLVVIYLVIGFWLRYRPGGRALYAIGGNEEARASLRPASALGQDPGLHDRRSTGGRRRVARHLAAGLRAARPPAPTICST